MSKQKTASERILEIKNKYFDRITATLEDFERGDLSDPDVAKKAYRLLADMQCNYEYITASEGDFE